MKKLFNKKNRVYWIIGVIVLVGFLYFNAQEKEDSDIQTASFVSIPKSERIGGISLRTDQVLAVKELTITSKHTCEDYAKAKKHNVVLGYLSIQDIRFGKVNYKDVETIYNNPITKTDILCSNLNPKKVTVIDDELLGVFISIWIGHPEEIVTFSKEKPFFNKPVFNKDSFNDRNITFVYSLFGGS